VDGTEGITGQTWERDQHVDNSHATLHIARSYLPPLPKEESARDCSISWGRQATVSTQSSAPIARKPGSRHFLGQLWPGLFPSDFLENSCGLKRKSGRYGQRNTWPAADGNARGSPLPYLTADGVMFFQLDAYTLYASADFNRGHAGTPIWEKWTHLSVSID